MNCLKCESTKVSEEYVNHYVPVRKETVVGITVRVPVRLCLSCGNRWLDWESEDIIDAAMKYLGP